MSGLQCEPHGSPVPEDGYDESATGGSTARTRELEARVAQLELEVRHLELAVESRTRIGTAIGLLAERHATTTAVAWALMTRLSNHTNSKLHEIARLLVAVADGTLEGEELEAVAVLARHLPRAAASVGIVDRTRDEVGRGRPRAVRLEPRPRPVPRVPPVLDGDQPS